MILFQIIFKNNESFRKRRNILSFKLHFILSNEKLFSFNSSQFANLYSDLFFIKHFYSYVYKNEIKEPYIIKIKDNKLIFSENNNDSYFADISLLFDKKDDKNYENIMNMNNGIIPHFYNINANNINKLINYSSYFIKNNAEKFLENIISLTDLKSYFIENHFNSYKASLINLEKDIYILAKKNLNKNKKGRIIDKYSPKDDYKNIYSNFVSELNKVMNYKYKRKYNNSYKLYPMGSLTEFLSVNDSDLDIYLYLEDKEKKYEIVEAIFDCVGSFCNNVEKIVSQRLCLINLIYKNTSIDLSVLGYPPYIHSLLFREYSLLDARFPMVGIALKYLKDILCLDKEFYINPYCWISLLVIFLQDIINPPILPKLYSNKDINDLIYESIEYGHYKKAKFDKDQYKIKNFFSSLKKETIPIPDCLYNKNKIYEIYHNDIIKVGKNKMSCAEILLKFIEFITFYFKYDTIYAESSINGEGFYNMDEIKNIYANNKKGTDDKIKIYNNEFHKYFTKKYLNYNIFRTKEKIRNGFILIRDPVDNHYNPGQKFCKEENLNNFINKLRYSYSILSIYGNFEKLKEKLEEQQKNI